MKSFAVCLLITLLLSMSLSPASAQGGGSLRFFGTGSGNIDRVRISLTAPRPIDVGGDFTLEFWMKPASGNTSGACTPGGDNWTNGNTIFDRDIFGAGDHGDYGVSLYGGRIAFGVNRLGSGTTLCGATVLAAGTWHHIAVVRRTATGQMQIYVNGALDAQGTGPTGNISYRDGRATSYANDPFLVIGAEKHDYAPAYPSYSGWIDEVRVSNIARYSANFTRPSAPFTTDANTVALFHFNEGSGAVVNDVSGAAGGPSNGQLLVGGANNGPQWSTDHPFNRPATPTPLTPANSALTWYRPTFTWSPVAGATRYELRLRRFVTGIPFTIVYSGSSTSYRPPTALLRRTPYRWMVRAVDASGNVSAWSPVRAFTTRP